VTTNVNSAPGGHFVLHIGALHGRPFDGHTLKPVLDQYEQQIGIKPERMYVDKGYRGHGFEPKNRVFKSGQKRGVTGTIKKELRRRSVVEPIIGHLKADHHLGRSYLKGTQGDKLNALLSGAGYNFRLLLKWFRLLFAQNPGLLSAKIREIWRQLLNHYNQIRQASPELQAF
jgi:IS5 family transposase